MGEQVGGRVDPHRGPAREIETLEEFDVRVSRGARSMRGWRLQSLDLRQRTDVLLGLDPAGALLLGCALSEEADAHLRHGGALVFPAIPDVPFDPYRGGLYTPEELYAGLPDRSYDQTPDARIYAWAQQGRFQRDVGATLARALHDHAIDDALAEHLQGRPVVGVMGGHDLRRGDSAFEAAARLGHRLAAGGLLVATGGGPGAMEAANLGAYLSGHDHDVVDKAVAVLAEVPAHRPSVTDWARVALDTRRRWPDGADSVGIPTWFYGHEPPNMFASTVAKFFQNALREDTLLHRCDRGIVFLPGAAGTVQEIFQAACENYYADESSVAPMVLVGRDYWTDRLPAWPLLETMSAGRAMRPAVICVGSVEEAARFVLEAE